MTTFHRSGDPQPSVAIIGAGFAGIAAAVALTRAGLDRFTIIDYADGPGGAWWHNRYPGAQVDTPSIMYSYSWMKWSWSGTHAGQAELQEYLQAVLERFGLEDRCRFGTRVTRVDWDDTRQRWDLTLVGERTEQIHADFVVSAVGLLSDPNETRFPGIEAFKGEVFHAARWPEHFNAKRRRVAVVGTGSTAAQVVPALAEEAEQVLLFQREPGWVMPKHARKFTPAERVALDSSLAQRLLRTRLLWRRDKARQGGGIWREGTPQHIAAERTARQFIDRVFADRPDLREMVTPRYVFGGKRPIISDEFYPSLLRDNVTVVPSAAREFDADGVVDGAGTHHQVDAIALCTGFKADFFTSFELRGRGGIEIHEAWQGEDTAFLGIMVPRFPNLFIMYGPNTNGGAIVTNFELQAKYAVAAIKHVWRRGASTVEVKPEAYERYDRFIQKRLVGTVFHFERNYYRSGSGRIATQWSDGVAMYAALTLALRRLAWTIGYGRPGSSAARTESSAK